MVQYYALTPEISPYNRRW